ncbi:hypothetical protein HPB47_007779, partial [Ixodes persulcatus]
DKLLLNGVDIRIVLRQNTEDFSLLAASTVPQKHVIQLPRIVLYIRRVQVAPTVLVGIERRLQSSPATYLLRGVEIKTRTVSPGVSHIVLDDLYPHRSRVFVQSRPDKTLLPRAPLTAFSIPAPRIHFFLTRSAAADRTRAAPPHCKLRRLRVAASPASPSPRLPRADRLISNSVLVRTSAASQQGKTPGVSYHQFPSDEELCSKWKKNVSRENLVINDKSASTVVCSKHFTENDYVPGYRIRKLRPGVVPMVFDQYPSYMVPATKRPRKEPAARGPSATSAPRQPTKRKAESSPSTYGECAPLEELTDERCSTSTQTIGNDAKLATRYPPTIVKRLRSQVAYQRSKCGSLAQQLVREQEKVKRFHEDKHCTAVKTIVNDAQNGDKKAVFLRHQIEVYGMERPSYSEEVIRECVIWRFISPKGYDHARTADLLTVPAKCTLQRYVGPSPTSSGMTNAMRERLLLEASMLSNKQHMASLIVDEASIKPKCVYDRKADAVYGFKDKPVNSAARTSENRGGDPSLYSYREASQTIFFMNMMKQWFDVHDTMYKGSDHKRPISNEDDPRLLWLEKEFTDYIKEVQEASLASGKEAFTEQTFHALLFTSRATVDATRSMCGGNDVLDARSVTVALDNIVKGKALCSKQMEVEDADAEELALSVPQEVIADLENLKGQLCDPSPSVTYSGLVYVGGYIVKLVTECRITDLIADRSGSC